MSLTSMPEHPHAGVNYQDFISTICKQRDVNKYLEIGVSDGVNISKVSAQTVYGVDPAFTLAVDPTIGKEQLRLYRMTSDKFFDRHSVDLKSSGGVEFAFLDGMHLFEYLLRDFANTEACSHPSGLIAMHDCLPFDGEMIERVPNFAARTSKLYGGAWTGDVWKIVPLLKKYRPDLKLVLVDCAPTGLICATGLDPKSSVLKDNYLSIVNEFLSMSNDLAAIKNLYSENEISSSIEILANYNQSLYFKM